MLWPDATTYEGQVKNGRPHGQGAKTWPNEEEQLN